MTTADQDARALLATEGGALGLDADQIGKLWTYIELIEKWNQVHNLTAVRGLENQVRQHLLDSLAVLPHVNAASMLDVGSGAGLPGIPLAIARPSLAMTLLDSNHKKTAFMRQAVATLKLTNVSVLDGRVEASSAATSEATGTMGATGATGATAAATVAAQASTQRYPLIISRAFAELADFVTLSAHRLAPGGVFIAMKGLHPYEEIARLPTAFRVREVIQLEVLSLAAARCLVLVENA